MFAKRRDLVFIMIFCAVVLIASQPDLTFAEEEVSISVGAEYTSGDYGTSPKTTIWYFPFTFKYESPANSVSLTIPYLRIRGSEGVVVAGVGMGMGGGMHRISLDTINVVEREDTGLGDVVVTGSHKINATNSTQFDVTGWIKFATADEKARLGTGENDYAVQLDLNRRFNGDRIFGTAGYKILGDPPGIDYRNVLYASIGLSRRLDSIRHAEIVYDGQQAVLAGVSRRSEMSLYLRSKVDQQTELAGYLLKGLSDGSPDWGVGIIVQFYR